MPADLQTWLIPALVLLLLAAVVWRLLVVRRARIIRLPPADSAAPVPAAAPPPAEPAPAPPLPAIAPAAGPPDDLRRIKGIGPRLEALLHELGVTRYDQIAGWSAAELAAIDARLGAFQGRPERDRWQEQARLLAAGDLKAFERLHGKIGDQA